MADDDDALLTAFADNALGADERSRLMARLAQDPRLRARLDEIEAGGRPFAPAFAALLEEAPMDRLRASLAAPLASNLGPEQASRTAKAWRIAQVAGAAAVLFIGGFAAGRFAAPSAPTQVASESRDDWRQAVANYMDLYTADTLREGSVDPALQAASLKALGDRLGTTLTPERIAIAGLPFERSELLSYEKAPLGQLAYLDPQAGPVLFCIIADSRPDAPVSNANVDGFATSSWAKGGRGYMVIGRISAEKVAAIAGELVQRF
jgi:anti-sigma factor RsiW